MRVEQRRGGPYAPPTVAMGSRTAPHPRHMVQKERAPQGSRTLIRGARVLTISRHKNETYGFHLKGGKEHGTGFFISHVENGSIAQKNGIHAGDQLLEVDGVAVTGAVHRDVANTIGGTSTVTLVLRETGIIPVKDRSGDPLTWLMVPNGEKGPNSKNVNPGVHERVYRIVIPAAGKSTLGFSVTHDPTARSGIYVQSVKRSGPADTAGLKINDQLLSCNGKDLSTMDNKQAINEIKKQSNIVLEVRRIIRPDLIAGESSGYNSSASSTAGEQTPPPTSSVHTRRMANRLGGMRNVGMEEAKPSVGVKKQSQITSRLSQVSNKLVERELKLVDGEWATAEADMKRRQLTLEQRRYEQHRYRGPSSKPLSRPSQSMSRSASDLLDPIQYEGPKSSTSYSSGQRNSSDYSSVGTIRPSHSSSNLLDEGGDHTTHSSIYSTTSCTSDDDSVANTVYSVYRNPSFLTKQSGTDGKMAANPAQPHVNNIVVESRVNSSEVDALSRLEQLSQSQDYASASELNLQSVFEEDSEEQDREVAIKLRKIQEQKRRLVAEEQRLMRERCKYEDQKRLQRTQSSTGPHYGPLVISCDSSTSDSSTLNSSDLTSRDNFPNSQSSFQQQRTYSRSPSPNYFGFRSPSPTPSSVSQRHTSRVIIKSDPPAPPKRHNSTTLTRSKNSQSTCCLASSCGCRHNSKHCSSLARQSKHCSSEYSSCSGQFCRHQRQNHHRVHCHRSHRHSPPSSPSSSSGVSCGSNPPLHSLLSRRCKSFDELSHSSNEDSSILWEEVRYHHHQQDASISSSISSESKAPGVIPPPPPQNFSLGKSSSISHLASSTRLSNMSNAAESTKGDLASALSLALQKRKIDDSSENDVDKAEAFEAKISAYKSDKQADPKKMQHEKLMEEFKLKHKKMFQAQDGEEDKSSSSSSSSSASSTTSEEADVKNIEVSTTEIIPAVTKVAITTTSNSTINPVKNSAKATSVAPSNNLVKSSVNSKAAADEFQTKVLLRSVSTTSGIKKPAPVPSESSQKKRQTIHTTKTEIEEVVGEDASKARNYWKTREGSVKEKSTKKVINSVFSKEIPKPKVQISTAKAAPTLISIQKTEVAKSSELEHPSIKQQVKEVKVEVSENKEDMASQPKSAAELIKSFNSSSPKATPMFTKSKPAPKAPAPKKPPTTYVSIQGPRNLSGITSGTNQSHLVKTQVQTSKSKKNNPSPPTQTQFTPPLDSNNEIVSISSHIPISLSDKYTTDAKYRKRQQSNPIDIVNMTENNDFMNISPTDLIIPKPPSHLTLETREVIIPQGVPPPPPLESWNERNGYGDWSHGNFDASSKPVIENKTEVVDKTTPTFKAMFANKEKESTKPLVSIDMYKSSKKPTPQKINLARVNSGSFDEKEEPEIEVKEPEMEVKEAEMSFESEESVDKTNSIQEESEDESESDGSETSENTELRERTESVSSSSSESSRQSSVREQSDSDEYESE